MGDFSRGLEVQELSSLPYAKFLRPLDEELERDGDYTEVHIDNAEFDEVEAGGSRFSESAITSVTFTGGSFDRVRLDDVWISRSRWIGGGWAEADLMNVSILDGVLAGVQAYGSQWRRVVVRNCKIDSLNLRGSRLQDVEFRDCDLAEVDFGQATLAGVTFPGSSIRRARFTKATVKKLDFRGARTLDVAEGWESLRGAVIDSTQLMESAAALAQTLGVSVKDR
ncbi:pentapeptide repeat-containing protein [Actinoplanes bogorensis]|uniref:Pentapeptide repeat-containing protein n=1 Tax=Paractinoplanes bogorensis TaxID=1610840 RepID=A0ABS5Z1V9_9ACTN|nr:pentapeptide repeat-containing protein [Actinoplanes bogorensis]MBU2669684.1 pentapeptide repeat-containing protein [Actinoplanes bogorensis]